MYKRGLIVGKFCPLHKGHEYLIQQARLQCERLCILSYTNPEFENCEPEKRRKWLKHTAPKAQIIVLDSSENIPENAAPDDVHRRFTAKICREKFGVIPDAVFTSERYGDGFADFLSHEFGTKVTHINIDQARHHVPISGSDIRENIHEKKTFLQPWIYASFVETVCFIGAESTGKSTLSKALAEIYRTDYVEEYGRTLWIEKDGKLIFDDYMKIAATHTAIEDSSRQLANQYLFIDTSPLTTLFYALEQFGKADKKLMDMSYRKYDHMFLCHPDFPMVQDGWRSGEDFRRRQHQWYVDILKSRGANYTNLRGSFDDKIETVKSTLLRRLR